MTRLPVARARSLWRQVAPGADAARPSAHARLAVIPPTARPPGPAPAARPRGQPGHTCAGVPSPCRAWTRFHRFPNIDFASKLIRKIIPRQTKQNKTKNLAMFLGLTYDSRQSGAAAGRALRRQGRTARGRRRPRRPGPHGDRTPRRPRSEVEREAPDWGPQGGRTRTPRDTPPCPARAARVPGCGGRPHPRSPGWICTLPPSPPQLEPQPWGPGCLLGPPSHAGASVLEMAVTIPAAVATPAPRGPDANGPRRRPAALDQREASKPVPFSGRAPLPGAEGTAFPQARAGKRSRRLLSSPGLSSRPASRMVT